MWEFLAPVDAARHIKTEGLAKAAERFGMSPDQLIEFLNTYKKREAPADSDTGELRETKEFNVSGFGQLKLWDYFPESVPAVGRPRKHDPAKIQRMLDELGRKETAKKMGISVGSLNNYINSYGLIPPRNKSARPDYFDLEKTLLEKTAKEAAFMYGVSVPTIYRWASEDGIQLSTKSNIPPKDELEQLLGRYTQAEVADVYGVHVLTVSRWARTYGIKSRRDRMRQYNFRELLRTHTMTEIESQTGFTEEEILKNILQNT